MMRLALLITCLILTTASLGGAKQCSRLITAQMRANAQANIARFGWAAAQRDAAVSAARPWAALSDDELWSLVPSQDVPRDIHTNKEAGCPNCGDGITPYGNYPWKTDFWKNPWKVTCPNCAETYPKNDFYAFYQSALDGHGFFRRELGDQALLFNAEHPDPNDPLHKVYVDDGYGMVDTQGRRHRPVAYYCQWAHWQNLLRAVPALANAYALTSEPLYAHKCAVLLDRIADVYPEMDFMPLHQLGFEHSHGGPGRGRIEGCIWETGTASRLSSAYDTIFDALAADAELIGFSAQKAQRYDLGDKSSAEALCRHIEDHLLIEFLISVKDGRISGNTGMTHTALATAAIALDREGVTDEWLDWLFDPGFPGEFTNSKDPLPWVLTEGLDRDGMGGECGGYGLIWTRSMVSLAELLASYPLYTRRNMVAEFPKLKQAYLIEARLNVLDATMPNIGDSGATGTYGRVGNPHTFARGYKLYGDPRLAGLAWRYANGNAEALRMSGDIYEAEPMALAEKIASVAEVGDTALQSDFLGRYGQAYLQTERPDNGRAIWVHHGYGKGHSHRDCLNLGLHAKNIDMLPDLGYPEYTGNWPKRGAWTSNTISHNTLLVGDSRSEYSPGGKLGLFCVQPPLRVLEASSKTAYADLERYHRTVALVDVSEEDSYVFDVFRAAGGANHRLSWHGPGSEAVIDGVQTVRQPTGTFAGPDVDFACLEGERADFYRTSGFTYLYDVERSTDVVSGAYTVDWRGEDLRGRIKPGHEPHLRLHSASGCDELALASGQPPQNKAGNPKSLRYLIQSRLGSELRSQFVNVLEPYDGAPFIRAVRSLAVEHDAEPGTVCAVAVELADGRTDVLVSCLEPTAVRVEGGIELDGKLCMVRLLGTQVQSMRLVQGTRLSFGQIELLADRAAYTGQVKAVDVSDPLDNRVSLDPPLPADAPLVGQTIHFGTELPLDTSYRIAALTPEGVSTGDITVVAGYNDAGDFASGLKYVVNPGDAYRVPCIVGLDR